MKNVELTHGGVGCSNYSIEEYYEKNSISCESREKINTFDFLILPYKYDNDFYFSQESVHFLKYCKNKYPQYKLDILADDKIQTRSLNSFDNWMPVTYVSSKLLLPIAIDIVSSYLLERIKGREDDKPQVDVTFKVQDGDKVKELHYKGDADVFKDKFNKIDINNL